MAKKPVRVELWRMFDDLIYFILVVICHWFWWTLLLIAIGVTERVWLYWILIWIISTSMRVTRE